MNEDRAKCKKKPGPPPPDCHDNGDEDHGHHECCTANPCLIMLRDAAKAEREAILFYLQAASMVCGDLRELFLGVARDEMEHFVMTMRHVSSLDPVQAEAFEDEGLDMLVPRRANTPKWVKGWHPACMPEMEPEECIPDMSPDHDLPAVCLLTKAIADELADINTYQEFMSASESEACCRHFCHLMNDEKRHVAEFTAALYQLTGEPPEADEDF